VLHTNKKLVRLSLSIHMTWYSKIDCFSTAETYLKSNIYGQGQAWSNGACITCKGTKGRLFYSMLKLSTLIVFKHHQGVDLKHFIPANSRLG